MYRLASLLSAAIVLVLVAFGQIEPEGSDEFDFGGFAFGRHERSAPGPLIRSDGTVILTAEQLDRIAAEAAMERAARRGDTSAPRMAVTDMEHGDIEPGTYT
ncbi:MAG: hypothetical protein HUJ24_08710, partial [Rhodobacteraceae bacterium]|nr:hypothetical protein [Paracoccaceae bacterium]